MKLLELFQKVKIDKEDFDENYARLKLGETGLNKKYCHNEIDKFYKYLETDGSDTLKQLRRLSRQLK